MQDINEIYIYTSSTDEKSAIIKSLKAEKIWEGERAVFIQIKLQQEKFFKKMKKFLWCYEYWKKKSDIVTGEFYNNKEILLTLSNKKLALSKNTPKNVFGEMRALDRVPQIDLCNEVHKRLDIISTEVLQRNFDGKIDEYNLKEQKNNLSNFLETTSFGEKFEKKRVIDLNDLLTQWYDGLKRLDEKLIISSAPKKEQKESLAINQKLDSLIEQRKNSIKNLKVLHTNLQSMLTS